MSKKSKITCTFPTYKYKLVRGKTILEEGDEFNYRRPKDSRYDYWMTVHESIGKPASYFNDSGWIVIRPIK